MASEPTLLEAVARAIDPWAFESWQNSYTYMVQQCGDPVKARDFADYCRDLKPIYERATAVIAVTDAAAQSEIASLKAEIERLREALRPFAAMGDTLSAESADDDELWFETDDGLTYGMFRRAREAMGADRG